MSPCYSKNGILKGAVDFYCLVCETYLRSESDNIDHIAKPIHKKNLDSTQYVKGYEEDFVRKIKMGYFCELCNKLLPMMARVKIHVKEPSHIDSKNVMFFKRIGVNVIAFGKVVLNEKAWNGLTDESCAFCNTEYEDEDIHKNLLSHILNIIQIKVEVDENKNIYRKIDDVSFHCLTCNMVLALNDIALHFEEDQHKHLYKKCCDISLNKTNKNESKENQSNKLSEDRSDKINDGLAKFLKNTGEKTEEVYRIGGSDVNTKCEVSEKTTTAIDLTPLNEIGENEDQSKITINSVVKKECEDSEKNSQDCVAIPSDKTAENKEESQAVKDIDVNIKNKNVVEKKVKKNKEKINPAELKSTQKSGTANHTVKTTRTKSSFDIEKYEKKICKILRTEDYITLDENGKTLCILCDWIMDPRSKKIHVTGQHHQTMEKMHKKRLADIRDKNNNESTTVLQNKSILDLVSKFQANNVNINLIFNTAVCKKCTVNLPYDVNAIEEHILKHNNESCKNTSKVTIKQNSDNTSKVTIKENSKNTSKVTTTEDSENTSKVTITENSENTIKVPIIENSENTIKVPIIENSENTIKENSKEENAITSHKEENLSTDDRNENEEPINKQAQVKIDEELTVETPLKDDANEIGEPSVSLNLQKQPLEIYIKTLNGVKHMIFSDIVINEIICISLLSFNYLISNKGEMKCLICEEEVSDFVAHINKFIHITLLNQKPVILNEKSEFVREIHTDLLHCGFCNMTESSWSEMQEHFNSSSHKETKNAAGWRLLLYSNECKVQNHNNIISEVSELAIRNMFNGLFE